METKDRIKLLMEEQHMTQQVFADFLQQSPATLSSIFNGRTRPTLNVIEAIKAKIPDISIEWLLYGSGEKYVTRPSASTDVVSEGSEGAQDLVLNFDETATYPQNVQLAGGHNNQLAGSQNSQHAATVYPSKVQNSGFNPSTNGQPGVAQVSMQYGQGLNGPRADFGREEAGITEKEPRRVTEIRVYYDDQTYETFVPSKK